MNLRESPRCIMMKLHPLVARRLANKLRSQFKLSNCRFLNVEAQRELTTHPHLGIAPVVPCNMLYTTICCVGPSQ